VPADAMGVAPAGAACVVSRNAEIQAARSRPLPSAQIIRANLSSGLRMT